MRKKTMVEQNLQYFNEIQELRFENSKLKEKLASKNEEIKDLNEKLNAKPVFAEPIPEGIEKIKKKVIKPEVSEDTEYASKAIGQIVVNSANHSTMLTANGETKYKDLVNLILGKAEVAKSEILGVVNSDNDLDTKKRLIDNIKNSASEYFDSVMAQKY